MIGGGLLYTLGIASGPGKWIGYQVLAGIGLGTGHQVPVIVAQALSTKEDVSLAVSAVLCL